MGKTTVRGLASALAHRGLRALLVDLDAQAGATKLLGIDTPARAEPGATPPRHPVGPCCTAMAAAIRPSAVVLGEYGVKLSSVLA